MIRELAIAFAGACAYAVAFAAVSATLAKRPSLPWMVGGSIGMLATLAIPFLGVASTGGSVPAFLGLAIAYLGLNLELITAIGGSLRDRTAHSGEVEPSSFFVVSRRRLSGALALALFLATGLGVGLSAGYFAGVVHLSPEPVPSRPSLLQLLALAVGLALGFRIGILPFRWCLMRLGGVPDDEVMRLLS